MKIRRIFLDRSTGRGRRLEVPPFQPRRLWLLVFAACLGGNPQSLQAALPYTTLVPEEGDFLIAEDWDNGLPGTENRPLIPVGKTGYLATGLLDVGELEVAGILDLSGDAILNVQLDSDLPGSTFLGSGTRLDLATAAGTDIGEMDLFEATLGLGPGVFNFQDAFHAAWSVIEAGPQTDLDISAEADLAYVSIEGGTWSFLTPQTIFLTDTYLENGTIWEFLQGATFLESSFFSEDNTGAILVSGETDIPDGFVLTCAVPFIQTSAKMFLGLGSKLVAQRRIRIPTVEMADRSIIEVTKAPGSSNESPFAEFSIIAEAGASTIPKLVLEGNGDGTSRVRIPDLFYSLDVEATNGFIVDLGDGFPRDFIFPVFLASDSRFEITGNSLNAEQVTFWGRVEIVDSNAGGQFTLFGDKLVLNSGSYFLGDNLAMSFAGFHATDSTVELIGGSWSQHQQLYLDQSTVLADEESFFQGVIGRDSLNELVFLDSRIEILEGSLDLSFTEGNAVITNNLYAGDFSIVFGAASIEEVDSSTIRVNGMDLQLEPAPPSALPPLFQLQGNWEWAAGSSLDLVVFSDQQTVIDCRGTLDLADVALVVDLLPGLVPAFDAVYPIITTTGLSGSFSNAPSGSRLETKDGSGSFLVSYGEGSSHGPDQVVLGQFVSTGQQLWGKFPVMESGYVDTGDWLGLLYPVTPEWVWCVQARSWFFIPASTANAGRGWIGTVAANQPMGTTAPLWGRFSISTGSYVQTGSWLGLLDVALDPWIWNAGMDKHFFIPGPVAAEGMGWVFTP